MHREEEVSCRSERVEKRAREAQEPGTSAHMRMCGRAGRTPPDPPPDPPRSPPTKTSLSSCDTSLRPSRFSPRPSHGPQASCVLSSRCSCCAWRAPRRSSRSPRRSSSSCPAGQPPRRRCFSRRPVSRLSLRTESRKRNSARPISLHVLLWPSAPSAVRALRHGHQLPSCMLRRSPTVAQPRSKSCC